MTAGWTYRLARTLVRCFVPGADREDLLGDLEEALADPESGFAQPRRYLYESVAAIWHLHTRDLPLHVGVRLFAATAASYALVLGSGCAAVVLASQGVAGSAGFAANASALRVAFLVGASLGAAASGYAARRVLSPSAFAPGARLLAMALAVPVCVASILALSPLSIVSLAWIALMPTCMLGGSRIGLRRNYAA